MRNRWTMNLSVFLLSILWCGQSGNDPHKDLAKFGYNIKIETSFYIFGYIHEPSIEMWRFFLEFCLNFGYRKSQKAFDFGTFNFEYNFLAMYSLWQKRAGSDTTPPLAAVKCLTNTPDANNFLFQKFFLHPNICRFWQGMSGAVIHHWSRLRIAWENCQLDLCRTGLK